MLIYGILQSRQAGDTSAQPQGHTCMMHPSQQQLCWCLSLLSMTYMQQHDQAVACITPAHMRLGCGCLLWSAAGPRLARLLCWRGRPAGMGACQQGAGGWVRVRGWVRGSKWVDG